MTTPASVPATDRQMEAMRALGQMRVRTLTWAFLLGWLVALPLLMLFGLGFLPALLVGMGAAGLFSRWFVRHRRDRMITRVCAQFGLLRDELGADRYLID